MNSKLMTVLPVMVLLLMFSGTAFAEAGTAAVGLGESGAGLVGLGAGMAVGLAALGCGLGQGRIAGEAMSGMARNPQVSGEIRTSMMIALAFPESLVLFCFAIGFLLLGAIGA